jgi:hypothetical protein
VALEWIKGRNGRMDLREWDRSTLRLFKRIIKATGGSLTEDNAMKLLGHAFASKPNLERPDDVRREIPRPRSRSSWTTETTSP